MTGVVLQHEPTFRPQQPVFENQIRDRVKRRQAIWRACEDVIVGFGAIRHKPEYIAPNDPDTAFHSKLSGGFLHKLHCRAMLVYVRDVGSSPGDKFVAMAAGTAEQIEHFELLEIDMVVQDIEKPFLGKIRRWPGRPIVCRRVEPPSFKYSPNDPHTPVLSISHQSR